MDAGARPRFHGRNGTPSPWPDAKNKAVGGSPTLIDLDVPVERIPALLVELAAAQANLQARLLMHRAPGAGNESTETLLEAKDVAEWLGVKEDYVRDLGRRGEIPTVKIGKYVRFERASIRAWIAQQRESDGLR
jgi:excisionase family DNA binding protein